MKKYNNMKKIALILNIILGVCIPFHAQENKEITLYQKSVTSRVDTVIPLNIFQSIFNEPVEEEIKLLSGRSKISNNVELVSSVVEGVIVGDSLQENKSRALINDPIGIRPPIELPIILSVGEIPINIETTPTGALSATVSIDVPRGITDLQPNLALSYNSQNGNSIAGYGWDLSGVSNITHRNLNHFYDGSTASAGNNIYNLILDGKRLIYNQTMADGRYLFYLEGSSGSVSAIGNLATIIIYYNNGITATFQDLYGTKNLQMTRIEDRFGNYMTYSYRDGYKTPYLTKISYGGNSKKGTSHFASIDFTYEIRNDQAMFFNIGTEIQIRERLKTVSTGEKLYIFNYTNGYFSLLNRIDCEGKIGTTGHLKSLNFSYGNGSSSNSLEKGEATLRSYFTDGNHKTIHAMSGRFSYGSKKEGIVTYPNKVPYQFGKIKGDNFETLHSMYHNDDVVFIAPTYEDATDYFGSYTLKANSGFRGVVSIDVDNFPSNQEVILINSSGGSGKGWNQTVSFRIFEYVGLANYGVRRTVNYTLPAHYMNNNYTSVTPISYQTGNFYGEGVDNICGIQSYNDKYSPVSAIYIFDIKKETYYRYQTPFRIEERDQTIVMDYDGDGKSDLFHFHGSGFDIYSFERDTSSSNTLAIKLVKVASNTAINRDHFDQEDKERTGNIFSAHWYARRKILFGDINGDGKLDILMTAQYGTKKGTQREMNGSTWTQCLSAGGGAFQVTKYDMPSHIWLDTYKDVFMHDFNGDGRSDIVCLRNGNLQIIQSTGTRIGTSVNNYNLGGLDGEGKIFTIDLKHSNHNRVIGFIRNNKLAKLSIKNNETTNTFLTQATNSMGKTTKITYSRLDGDPNSGGYSPYYSVGSGATFPYQNFDDYYWAVTGVQSTINSGIVQDLSFTYSNGIVHKQGLGFRGFEKINTYDRINGFSNTILYDPLQWGTVKQTILKDKQIDYKYNISLTNKKEAIIRLAEEKITDQLTGYITTTNNTFDTYGNITQAITKYGSDVIKQVNTTYKNNISNTFNLTGLPLAKQEKIQRNGLTHLTSEDYTYNASNLVSSIIQKINGNTQTIKSYEYDAFSNVLVEKDSPYGIAKNTVILINTYYSNGRDLHTTKNNLGHITTYTYTNNLLSSAKDHKNNVTNYEYDAFGRLVKTTNPDGTVFTKSIKFSSVFGSYFSVEETETDSPAKINYYDQIGRNVASGKMHYDGSYVYTQTVYNSKGLTEKTSLPTKSTTPSSWNSIVYDTYNRPITLNYASGRKETHSYNKNTITSVIDGVTTTKTLDATGKEVAISDPAGTITYKYRPDGQPISITAPGNVISTFEYDGYGRQTKLADPSSGTTTFAYDVNNNIFTTTDARGKVTKTTYNEKSQLIKKEIVGELTTNYVYNTDGLLTNETNSNSTSRIYTYDNFGRKLTDKENSIDGKWFQKIIAYSNGVVSTIDYLSSTTSGKIVTENYFYQNGCLSEIKLNNTTSIWKITSENNLGKITSSTSGSLTNTLTYDSYGNPTGRIMKNGNTIIQNVSYSFNAQTGNLNWRKDNVRNIQENFGYDNLNRLTSFGGKTISYDNKSNKTDISTIGKFQYNTSRPYAIEQVTPYGNSIPSRTQDITYNGLSRLSSITENNNVATFTYNNQGNRLKMNVKNNGKDITNHYYFDNKYEIEIGTSATKEFLYLGGDAYSANAVYVRQGGTWSIHYLGRDYLGSITHIVNSAGNLVQELSYDPWGQLRNPANQVIYANGSEPTLFLGRGYTGHEHLSIFGLINMNARLYDSALGCFISPDPFVQVPNLSINFNRYLYANGNPLRFVDPNGEILWVPIIIGAAIGAYMGGVVANDGCFNPTKWDWSSGKTWGYMLGGAVIGGASGYLGATVAASGMPMANTAGMMTGSLANSLGMNIITSGAVPISINFGVGSYDFSNGDWGFLGEKGNSFIENLGYFMGAMANVSDILAGYKPVKATLATENNPDFSPAGDFIGHSQLGIDGEVLIDWGPSSSNGKLFNLPEGTNSYKGGTYTPNQIGTKFWDPQPVFGVNEKTIRWYSGVLNKGGKYQLVVNSCVSQTSRALNLSGVFNIGIHPYILHTQMFLRNIGARPMLFLHYTHSNGTRNLK